MVLNHYHSSPTSSLNTNFKPHLLPKVSGRWSTFFMLEFKRECRFVLKKFKKKNVYVLPFEIRNQQNVKVFFTIEQSQRL